MNDCADLQKHLYNNNSDNYIFSLDEDKFGAYFTKTIKKKKLKKTGLNPKKRQYQKFEKAKLLRDIDYDFHKEVENYWQEFYGQYIETTLHAALHNVHDIKDRRIIPGKLMRDEIVPYLNISRDKNMYKDKNLYDIFINTDQQPKTILKRVRNNYFDGENNYIDQNKILTKIYNEGSDVIIKPTNTNNGIGIRKLKVNSEGVFIGEKKVTISYLEKMFGSNFIVQEIIKQHDAMATPHPSSVNTLRVVTLRWKGEIHHLLTFARFGANNSVNDNAGTGGVCVGVDDNGYLLNQGIDEDARVHYCHPTTGYSFSENLLIPNYEQVKNFAKSLHKNILHHDYISWDFAINEDGNPIFIEANFSGATWIYQLSTGKGVFGDLTDDILMHISEEFSNKNYTRNKGPKK